MVICRIFDDTSYSKKVIKYSAIITKVSEKPFKDGQFAYNVRHKDGGDEFVLESELLHRQSDGIWVPFEP